MKTSNWLLLGGGALAAYYLFSKGTQKKSGCNCNKNIANVVSDAKSTTSSIPPSSTPIAQSKVDVSAVIPIPKPPIVDANSVILSPLNSMIVPSDYQKMESWQKNVNTHQQSYASEQANEIMINKVNNQGSPFAPSSVKNFY